MFLPSARPTHGPALTFGIALPTTVREMPERGVAETREYASDADLVNVARAKPG